MSKKLDRQWLLVVSLAVLYMPKADICKAMKKLVSYFLAYSACMLCVSAQHWLPVDTALRKNGWGHKLYNDSVDDKLYLFGSFATIGSINTRHIVAYDGTSWDSLDGGPNSEGSGNVQCAIRYGDYIVAGGRFCVMAAPFCADTGAIPANNIAAWDGQWHPLGDGIDGAVYRLMVDGGYLYVGGGFSSAGGIPANGLARWDGQQWHSLGIPDYGGNIIKAMAMYKGELYIGGNFFNGVPGIRDIVRWNGQEWHDVGGGLYGPLSEIQDMVVYKEELYISGTFSLNDNPNNPGNYIARWDGEQWKPVGEGVLGLNADPQANGQIWDMHVFNGKLYASGVFQYASDIFAPYLASWDGNRWCSMYSSSVYGLGIGWPTYMTHRNDTLYVVGNFSIPNHPDGQGNTARMELIAKYAGGDETCGQVYTTDIDEYGLHSPSLLAYPNPTNTTITVTLPSDVYATHAIILNGLGQEMLRLNPLTDMDVSRLGAGFYLLRVFNGTDPIGETTFVKY